MVLTRPLFPTSFIVSFSGTPSLTANNFALEVSQLVPLKPGIGIYSSSEGNAPFFNHILYLGSPIKRILPAQVSCAVGTATVPIPIDPSLPGTTRYFQYWSRDPAHPDLTGAEVSGALKVVFCP